MMDGLRDLLDPLALQEVVAPIEGARTLPPQCYADERFFQLELQHIFRSSWCGVGRADRVADAGSYSAFELAGVPVILVRDTEGVLRAFSNSCRHRGMKIAADGEGRCRRFTCPFHAWTYGLDGRLVGTPRMEDAEDFSRDDYGLVSIRCATRHGFVFLNLDGDAPEVDDWLGDFPTIHAPWPLADLVTTQRKEFSVDCNWKPILEVFNEYYHLPFVHGRTVAGLYAKPEAANKVSGAYASQFGAHKENARGGVLMDDEGAGFPTIETLSGDARAGTRYTWVFPNLAFAASSDALWALEAYPQTPVSTRVAMSVCFPRQTVALADFEARAASYYRRMDAAMAEDIAALEQQQLGLSSPLAVPGRFAPVLEASVHAFQAWLAGRLLSARDARESAAMYKHAVG